MVNSSYLKWKKQLDALHCGKQYSTLYAQCVLCTLAGVCSGVLCVCKVCLHAVLSVQGLFCTDPGVS